MHSAICVLALSLLQRHALGFAPIVSHRQPTLAAPFHNIVSLQESKVKVVDKIDVDITADASDPALAAGLTEQQQSNTGWSYGEFARQYPNVNNIGIATIKTASADLLAQVAIAHTPVSDIDWQRAFLFCAFGATYLGAFQYWYQVNIFKKIFDVDKFTSQPWGDKLKDTEGLKSLAAQTAVDLAVLTLIYLPTFYVFKAGVFSGSADPGIWFSQGIDNYTNNFAKDEFDLVRVWAPADLVCFSVPLYLRLPVRHIVSFVWTAYLSFSRGGH